MTHYQQILVNMVIDNDMTEEDLEILKRHIEECIQTHADPDMVKNVRVQIN